MSTMPAKREVYIPIVVQESNIGSWSEDMPIQIKLAKIWNRYMPRGKGWVPRFIGNLVGRDTKFLMKTKHGAYLAVEPASLDVYVHMLNHGCTWNEHVLNACQSFLFEGAVFYDIGANVGYLSLEMAKIFQDEISVIAFEPQFRLAQLIAMSSNLNKFHNVKVFDLMLSDREGEADLFVGSHSIHASSIARERKSACIRRTSTTIDAMIQAGSIPPPHVIKIDVEGGEFAVLSGAKETISTFLPHIVFESDQNMERFGYSRREMLRLLKDLGPYDFWFVADGNGELIKVNESNLSFNYSDIAAIPRK